MDIRTASIKSRARFENKKRKLDAFMSLVKAEEREERKETSDGSEIRTIVVTPADRTSIQMLDQAERLRQERKIRRNEYRNRPRIVLLDAGHRAQLTATEVLPVSLFEVQATLIACLLPPQILPFRPTICEVQRSQTASRVTVFVLTDDVSLQMDGMDGLNFQQAIRFAVEENWTDKLLHVPLTGGQLRKLQEKGAEVGDVRSEEAGEDVSRKGDEPGAKRTDLLLSAEQMKAENFPLPHVAGEVKDDDDDDEFIPTLDHYDPVCNESPMFSLDCEMCRTTSGELEVTRVTLVNEREEVVIETFVHPENRITDYLTEYSGVTADDLRDVVTRVSDVRQLVKSVLPADAILVGQSLEQDLRKLRLTHPYVIDTSVIFNLSGTRQVKASLKFLAKRFLSMDIQSGYGHCSREDAIAALRLVQLKLEKGIRFGDAVIDPLKATWMKGKGHLVPLAHFINAKGIDFKVFYDYSPDPADSGTRRCMLILGPKSAARAKQMIFQTLSACSGSPDEHSICIVVTSDGRCFLSCK